MPCPARPPPPPATWCTLPGPPSPLPPFPFFFSAELNRTAMAVPTSSPFGSAPAAHPSSRAPMVKPHLAPQPSSTTSSRFCLLLRAETSTAAPCLPEPSLQFRRPMPVLSSPRPRPRATLVALPEMPLFPPPSASWNAVVPPSHPSSVRTTARTHPSSLFPLNPPHTCPVISLTCRVDAGLPLPSRAILRHQNAATPASPHHLTDARPPR
jgi:hypothetical protein